ncbi:hypothetical protein [Caulobacter sp. 17J65-9]|uniref:hypothetical protein n=1 Tax=Caulobacter sp. 17J65-9 TaxID=2709382 RepID=UPI0013CC7EF8|nr:hypothetical protein [Caulobacter sp. 17J65-9]NEX93142.1 hypothetical protein [Caulobacter sp. 17J65-9]
MTARSLLAALAASGLLGGAAQADPWIEHADTRAETDALIRKANAETLFVNEPQGLLLGARHTKSGLLCTFAPGDRTNRIQVYAPAEPREARGDEVGCVSEVNGVFQSLQAARGADGGLDDAFRRAVDSVKLATPFARTYEGDHAQNAEVDLDGRPLPLADHRTGRFVVELDGRKLYTRVSVAVVDGWRIKQWVTGPLDDAVGLDVEAESMMTMVLVDFAMKAQAGAAHSTPTALP